MTVDYGAGMESQIDALKAISALPAPVSAPSPIVDFRDEEASLEERARSYLHGNCAHCHRPGGFTPPNLEMDLRYQTPTKDTGMCGVPMMYENAWVPGRVRVTAGDSENSVLYQRMMVRNYGQMPLFGTAIVDDDAEVVGAWIDSMDRCAE